jgi:hypothetical protein
LPPHDVVDITPILPETNVVPPSGGLNTEINTVPGWAMSVVVCSCDGCNQFVTAGKRRHPKRVVPTHQAVTAEVVAVDSQQGLAAPAVVLVGEMDAMDGKGGQDPQERTVTSVIASNAKTRDLAIVAIGLHLRQTVGRQARCRAGIREGWQD